MPAERELDPSGSIEQFLGNMVRTARKAKGWTQKHVADEVYSNLATISEVEGGQLPDRELAVKLGYVLGLGEAVANLVKLAQQGTVLDYAQPFLANQERAKMMHAASFTVPGLLQTPDYARDLLLAGQAGDPRDIDSFVEQRMARQAVWEREDPPWFSLVLSEAVLHQASAAQLERLLVAQQKPNISIQLLPLPGGHIMGTTYVLTLPNGSRGAYTEGYLTGKYSEDSDTVLLFQRVYDRYAARALSAEASTDRIYEALKRET
ncbi:Scr1 family TA system antitoxin-like transcriptional regulator [Streptomyces sp. NPDC012769]|uniref:helix-turn-helix domain-containing protein n=1 Tax=Streptomyces sp. NPDC012769 TaxID=3364848 RepID=UPI0036BDDC4B